MFTPFRPGTSWLHRASPASKLIALAAAGTGLFWVESPALMVLMAALALALFPLSRLPLRDAMDQHRPVALLGALIVLVQGFIGGPEAALLVGARLVALLLLAGLVTLTTRTQDMIQTIETALKPLSRFGINPARTALALSLAVRFIPITARIVTEVREAQRVRGLDNNILALAVPTIIRALRLTDEVADAIEARGFDTEQGTP